MDACIERKKEAIRENNYNFHHEDVLKIEEEVEHIEH